MKKFILNRKKPRREADFSAAVQVVQDDFYFFIGNCKIPKIWEFLEPKK